MIFVEPTPPDPYLDQGYAILPSWIDATDLVMVMDIVKFLLDLRL